MPFEHIMRKYKSGDLKSGSGAKVKSRSQALAIAQKYPHETSPGKYGKHSKKKGRGFASLG